MPNWKMAKAFGRAQQLGSKQGRELINNSNTVKNRAGDWQMHGNDTPRQRAYKEGQHQAVDYDYPMGKTIAEERQMQRMDPTAKQVYQNYDFDYERSYGPEGAYQQARRGIEDAPSSRVDFEDRFGWDPADGPTPSKRSIDRGIDKAIDEESDRALQKGFDEEFDQAIRRHDLSRETEADLRNEAIDMLKTGRDISDVLEFLRGRFKY